MLIGEVEKLYPSAKSLVKEKVASRIFRKDAALFDFSDQACAVAQNRMGWTDLASNPPLKLQAIKDFANEVLAQGIKTIVLIGQGGSTQAPMSITKYNKPDSYHQVAFRTLDSVSPVRVRELFAEAELKSTLFIVSSKSGSTIEPRLALRAVRKELAQVMDAAEIAQHFVAITDADSELEKQAKEEGWLAVFSGESSVGGRFSALSVFGLLPAALAGIDIDDFIAHALEAEKRCSEDAIDNPAIGLAAFLYDNYLLGRDKFSFLTPKRGRVFGLWIEQLVAESLGKDGQGILPNIELDALMLSHDTGDRSAIVYQTKTDLWDERKNFEMGLTYIDNAIPRVNFKIDSVAELAEHFVMWEYAITMCGYLMKLCPFDEPDVSSAKEAVLGILKEGQPTPDFIEAHIGEIHTGAIEITLAPCFAHTHDLQSALRAFFDSIGAGDYFALNAFLPFTGEGRREALENIRHAVGDKRSVASCLEVGPRYLHSTGQFQKGGPNKGAFLIVSADELKDIPLEGEAQSLGALAKAQAAGDLKVLVERGRRCIHLHLPDNSGVTLRVLSDLIVKTLEELAQERALSGSFGEGVRDKVKSATDSSANNS
ncbi:MAG: glucose-6-phosphate isomerase [Eggerthellaceae bacterium]|jgi:glucose-6-phosphate isomerase|nr:glucose-6-phosphate isomerase [Eggerthellaceae bacterium]MDR2721697.1 hypothetical protein [Coriobacteriaceae bacterium]